MDVGPECGALFVTGGDVAHSFAPRERVEDVRGFLAAHREDVIAAFGLEAFDEQAGSGPSGADPSDGYPRRRIGTSRAARTSTQAIAGSVGGSVPSVSVRTHSMLEPGNLARSIAG